MSDGGLKDYPYVVVRFACRDCSRLGRYRLSSPLLASPRMAVSFGVELHHSVLDGAVEVIRTGDRLMREVMSLQVAPEDLDRIVMTTLDCWFVLRSERV